MSKGHKFNSESARKAGQKRGKHKKTKMWEQLGEFLVNDGAELFMNNVKDMMSSLDPKEVATGMSMYKDTLEFFKPKLSRSDTDLTSGGNPIDHNFTLNIVDGTKDQ